MTTAQRVVLRHKNTALVLTVMCVSFGHLFIVLGNCNINLLEESPCVCNQIDVTDILTVTKCKVTSREMMQQPPLQGR